MKEDDRVERLLREFYLSDHYRPNHRPSADRTRAVIRFTLEASLQGADTVTEAMLEAGSRVLCRAYELDDGWDEKQAEKHAASEMGLNFRREARDCYTAMRTVAPTAQDDTGARLDADWKQLQDDLAKSRGEQSPDVPREPGE